MLKRLVLEVTPELYAALAWQAEHANPQRDIDDYAVDALRQHLMDCHDSRAMQGTSDPEAQRLWLAAELTMKGSTKL